MGVNPGGFIHICASVPLLKGSGSVGFGAGVVGMVSVTGKLRSDDREWSGGGSVVGLALGLGL